MCRFDEKIKPYAPAPSACLIKSQKKLLALRLDDSDKWQLPLAKANQSLSAQCSVHKRVWKSTGLNVSVGELLFIDKHNTHHFSCHLTDTHSRELTDIPVPDWAPRNVEQVSLVNPFATNGNSWTSMTDLIAVREAFNRQE